MMQYKTNMETDREIHDHVQIRPDVLVAVTNELYPNTIQKLRKIPKFIEACREHFPETDPVDAFLNLRTTNRQNFVRFNKGVYTYTVAAAVLETNSAISNYLEIKRLPEDISDIIFSFQRPELFDRLSEQMAIATLPQDGSSTAVSPSILYQPASKMRYYWFPDQQNAPVYCNSQIAIDGVRGMIASI